MGKAGQYRKRARQVQRRAERALPAVMKNGLYVPPARSAQFHKSWVTPLDDLRTLQIRFETWKQNGTMVEFAMMLQSRYLGAWANVAHADICHGHAHVHLKPAPNSEKELVHHVARLDLASHVGDAFDACHDFLDKLGKQIRDNTNEEETDDGHTAIAR